MANVEMASRQVVGLAARAPGDPSDAADRTLDAMREELRDALDAVDRVRLIVRDLRVFSRADDDRPGPIDVVPLLESILRMAHNRIGDHVHLIRVSTRLDVAGRVVIAVADTGAGIEPEVQARLFTPFFSTRPTGDGIGLGLSMCHRIVAALGGEITFDSEPGEGSEFRVALLVAAPAPEVPAGAAAAPRRGRVMIVDDDPLVTRTVKRALTADHDVVAFHSGVQALDAIRAGARFDAIVCDLMMPQKSGMELHEDLLREAPELAARMVFLTGGAFTERARAFLDGVANPRLDKPFETRGLRALIAGVVR
jgi:CheY-like chemotaxis protein